MCDDNDNNEVRCLKLRTAFQELYDSLREDIWSETAIGTKDKLVELEEDIFAILTSLNKSAIEFRIQEILVLCESIKTINVKLVELKKEIDVFTNNFHLESQLKEKIDKAINTASNFSLLLT